MRKLLKKLAACIYSISNRFSLQYTYTYYMIERVKFQDSLKKVNFKVTDNLIKCDYVMEGHIDGNKCIITKIDTLYENGNMIRHNIPIKVFDIVKGIVNTTKYTLFIHVDAIIETEATLNFFYRVENKLMRSDVVGYNLAQSLCFFMEELHFANNVHDIEITSGGCHVATFKKVSQNLISSFIVYTLDEASIDRSEASRYLGMYLGSKYNSIKYSIQ